MKKNNKTLLVWWRNIITALFNIWCNIVTWWHKKINNIIITDEKLTLYSNGVVYEFKKMTPQYRLKEYRLERGQKNPQEVQKDNKLIDRLLGKFKYNTLLRYAGIICMENGGHLTLIGYSLEKGFFKSNQEAWQINDLLYQKIHNKSFLDEYYFPLQSDRLVRL